MRKKRTVLVGFVTIFIFLLCPQLVAQNSLRIYPNKSLIGIKKTGDTYTKQTVDVSSDKGFLIGKDGNSLGRGYLEFDLSIIPLENDEGASIKEVRIQLTSVIDFSITNFDGNIKIGECNQVADAAAAYWDFLNVLSPLISHKFETAGDGYAIKSDRIKDNIKNGNEKLYLAIQHKYENSNCVKISDKEIDLYIEVYYSSDPTTPPDEITNIEGPEICFVGEKVIYSNDCFYCGDPSPAPQKAEWFYKTTYFKHISNPILGKVIELEAIAPVEKTTITTRIFTRLSGTEYVESSRGSIDVKILPRPEMKLLSNNVVCENREVSYTILNCPPEAIVEWIGVQNITLLSGQNTSNAIFKTTEWAYGQAIARANIKYKGRDIYITNDELWVGAPKAVTEEKEYYADAMNNPIQLTAEFTGKFNPRDIKWKIISGHGRLQQEDYDKIVLVPTAALDFRDIIVESSVENGCRETSMKHRVHLTQMREPLRIVPQFIKACIGDNLEFRIEGDYTGGTIEWLQTNCEIVTGQGTAKAIFRCNEGWQKSVVAKVTYKNSYAQTEEVIFGHVFDVDEPLITRDQIFDIKLFETKTIHAPSGTRISSWSVKEQQIPNYEILEKDNEKITVKAKFSGTIQIKGVFSNNCGSYSENYTINIVSPKYEISGPDYIQYGQEAEFTIIGIQPGDSIIWGDCINLCLISGKNLPTAKFHAIENDETAETCNVHARIFLSANDFTGAVKIVSMGHSPSPLAYKSTNEEVFSSVKLYPNPTDGFFSVEVDNIHKGQYTIINLNGNIIKTGNFNSRSFNIDISANPAGIYILTLISNNERKSLRIIKR